MKDNFYLAVGYPLGRVRQDYDSFLIQGKKDVNEINGLYYSVWNLVWQYKTLNEILNHKIDFNIHDNDLVLEILDELKKINLVIEIDVNNAEEIKKSIGQLTYDKYGLGLGHEPIDNVDEEYVIANGQYVRVGIVTYAIWCEGNRSKDINEILEVVSSDFELDINLNLESLIWSVLYLYEFKLIIIKG